MPRHHLVPQMLLRRFADAQERIVMVERVVPHVARTTKVRTACAEVGFYEIPTDDVEVSSRAGHDPEAVERILSEVEGSAAPMLDRLLAGAFPPSDEERFRVSLFVALQFTRGWSFRQDVNDLEP